MNRSFILFSIMKMAKLQQHPPDIIVLSGFLHFPHKKYLTPLDFFHCLGYNKLALIKREC